MLVVVNHCNSDLACLQQFLHYYCKRTSQIPNSKAACITREPNGILIWHQNTIININSLSGLTLKSLESDSKSLLTFLSDKRSLEKAEKIFLGNDINSINARLVVLAEKKFLCAPLKTNKSDTFCYHNSTSTDQANRFLKKRIQEGMVYSKRKINRRVYEFALDDGLAYVRDGNNLFAFQRREMKPIKPLINKILGR
jgi:hypothetical protein